MKKVLSLILIVTMLLGCMSITAFAADSEGLEYGLNEDGDGYVVTGMGSCTDTNLVIPATHNGLPVTEVGSRAFEKCSSLTSVSMPSVTNVRNSAFFFCKSLTSVSMPSVTNIGNYAFYGCPIKNIVVSDALETIGANNHFTSDTTVNCHEVSDINAVKSVFETAGYNDLKYIQTEHNFVDGVCSICGISKPEDDFLTSFTLSKDYNDKYNTGSKNTNVNETLIFTITPVTANAPAFANNGAVTMNVTNGVGSVDVTLPTVTKAGEYWYTLKETGGASAGVTYDESTYYLHLVTALKDSEYGVVSAAIHTNAPNSNGTYADDDKITNITNTYAEGKLTVTQEAVLNGAPNTDDTFTETVTFTSDKTITGNITYGDKTITPDMWKYGSVSVDVDLKGGESVIFENIPDGVTYTVVQKTKADGYDDATYTIEEETGDEATETGITGTISDTSDTATVHNEKSTPIDVGVVLENGAFIVITFGAMTLGAWLVASKRKKREYDAE